jgi:hypothetical protein
MTKEKTITDKNNLVGKEIKKIKDEQERQELLFAAEELLPKTKTDRELEKHELRNGRIFTMKEVKDLTNNQPDDYFPMFPNANPFFKWMFKLKGWNLNPNEFIKPPCCAIYIKQYIYGRFQPEMLPTLLSKPNPLIFGYIRQYKLFQYLNEEGRRLMQGYIEDAINVMEESKDWYDFELTYTKKYNLPVQLKCIIEN